MNKIYSSAILLSLLMLSCKKETPPSPKPLEISVTTVDEEEEETTTKSAPGIYLKLNKDFFQKKIIKSFH